MTLVWCQGDKSHQQPAFPGRLPFRLSPEKWFFDSWVWKVRWGFCGCWGLGPWQAQVCESSLYIAHRWSRRAPSPVQLPWALWNLPGLSSPAMVCGVRIHVVTFGSHPGVIPPTAVAPISSLSWEAKHRQNQAPHCPTQFGVMGSSRQVLKWAL